MEQGIAFREERIEMLEKELNDFKRIIKSLERKLNYGKYLLSNQNTQIVNTIKKQFATLEKLQMVDNEAKYMQQLAKEVNRLMQSSHIANSLIIAKHFEESSNLKSQLAKWKIKTKSWKRRVSREFEYLTPNCRKKIQIHYESKVEETEVNTQGDNSNLINDHEENCKSHLICNQKSNGNNPVTQDRNAPSEAATSGKEYDAGQCENHSSAINGHDKHEEEIANLKARFLQHKKILTSNYEQSENEVNRLDEMYHDTIDMVLQAFDSIPLVVNSHDQLTKLHHLRTHDQIPIVCNSVLRSTKGNDWIPTSLIKASQQLTKTQDSRLIRKCFVI